MALYSGELAPKEFDTIELSPAAKPATVTYKFKGEVVRVLKLTYSGTELEKVEVTT